MAAAGTEGGDAGLDGRVPGAAGGAADGGIAAADGEGSVPIDWQALALAETHPLRLCILEVLGIEGRRILSPSDLSVELQLPVPNVGYHVGELHAAGLVELVRTQKVRGATEHFYCLSCPPATGAGRDPAGSPTPLR